MRYAYRRRRKTKWLILLIILVLIAGFLWFKKDRVQAPAPSQSNQNVSEEETRPSLPVIDLQPTLDTWAAKINGTAGVVIIDLYNNKTVASLNPDKVYFSASIYKLYAAYLGYQKVADGTYKMGDSYLSGFTRSKCLDEMIRSSHIPCGEKMAVELGSANIMSKLKSYGAVNTTFSGAYATTSAGDAAIVLQRLFEKRDLTEQHTNLMLDSMKDQPALYRRGLPSGFTKSTVYDKVGWNENLEWHDTAIVTLPNGRSYVVSVLTRSVGSRNIVELGKAIEAKLTE